MKFIKNFISQQLWNGLPGVDWLGVSNGVTVQMSAGLSIIWILLGLKDLVVRSLMWLLAENLSSLPGGRLMTWQLLQSKWSQTDREIHNIPMT